MCRSAQWFDRLPREGGFRDILPDASSRTSSTKRQNPQQVRERERCSSSILLVEIGCQRTSGEGSSWSVFHDLPARCRSDPLVRMLSPLCTLFKGNHHA